MTCRQILAFTRAHERGDISHAAFLAALVDPDDPAGSLRRFSLVMAGVTVVYGAAIGGICWAYARFIAWLVAGVNAGTLPGSRPLSPWWLVPVALGPVAALFVVNRAVLGAWMLRLPEWIGGSEGPAEGRDRP